MFDSFSGVLSASKQIDEGPSQALLSNAISSVASAQSQADGVVDKYARQYVMLQELGVDTEGKVVDHTDQSRLVAARLSYNQAAIKVKSTRAEMEARIAALKDLSVVTSITTAACVASRAGNHDFNALNVNHNFMIPLYPPTSKEVESLDLTMHAAVANGVYTGVYPDGTKRDVAYLYRRVGTSQGITMSIAVRGRIYAEATDLNSINGLYFCGSWVVLFTDNAGMKVAVKLKTSVLKQSFPTPVSWDQVQQMSLCIGTMVSNDPNPDIVAMSLDTYANMLRQRPGGIKVALQLAVPAIALQSSSDHTRTDGFRPLDGSKIDMDSSQVIYTDDISSPSFTKLIAQHQNSAIDSVAFWDAFAACGDSMINYMLKPDVTDLNAYDGQDTAILTYPQYINYSEGSDLAAMIINSDFANAMGGGKGSAGFPMGPGWALDSIPNHVASIIDDDVISDYDPMSVLSYTQSEDKNITIDAHITGTALRDVIVPSGLDNYLDAIEAAMFS